jgi:hypothetical protein
MMEEDYQGYRVPGSRVVHENEDCHHLDNANGVEETEKDPDEYDGLRTCRQCHLDNMSFSERRERERRFRKGRRNKTVKIRY